MKYLLVIGFFLSLCCIVFCAPAENNLDKANVNDPFLNDVVASNRAKLDAVSNIDHQITSSTPEFKPKPAGPGFARLIEDIFQIPIGVLQSVSRLLTNPFKQLNHGGAHESASSTTPLH